MHGGDKRVTRAQPDRLLDVEKSRLRLAEIHVRETELAERRRIAVIERHRSLRLDARSPNRA